MSGFILFYVLCMTKWFAFNTNLDVIWSDSFYFLKCVSRECFKLVNVPCALVFAEEYLNVPSLHTFFFDTH